MIISQMVQAKLLKGASPVNAGTGAKGFLFGGFLLFDGASPVAEGDDNINTGMLSMRSVRRSMRRGRTSR